MLEINYYISRLPGIISKPNFSPLSLNNSLRYFLTDWESPLPQLVFSIN